MAQMAAKASLIAGQVYADCSGHCHLQLFYHCPITVTGKDGKLTELGNPEAGPCSCGQLECDTDDHLFPLVFSP